MAENKYWKSLEEKYSDSDFIKQSSKEFQEELPVLLGEKGIEKISAGRRDFLKFLGFSITAATVAAGCEMPVRKSIPYLVKPDEIIPGVANYYASTYFDGSDYVSILVKTREGRPIKIEGNELSPVTRGGTSAVAQASVLSLYDNFRPKGPIAKGREISWQEADKEVAEQLAAIQTKGGQIRIVTSSIISPSLKHAIKEFLARYPNTKHITYDAVSYSGLLDANEKSFGIRAIPSYNFDQADVIVSIGADFLRSWVSPVEFSAQYAIRRKVNKENPDNLSKHFQFESILSQAGSNADKRVVVKPSQQDAVVLALYGALTGANWSTGLDEATINAVKEAATALLAAKGKSIVISGSNQPDTQTLVNAINHLLGNYGNTIDFTSYYNLKQGNDRELTAFISELKSGAIEAVLFIACNPLYNLPDANEVKEALQKTTLTVSLSEQRDETALALQYHLPAHHYLENWGDAEPKAGHFSIIQPTIAPLFNTRNEIETLLALTGKNVNAYDYIRAYWEQYIYPAQNTITPFSLFWDKSVHDGVVTINKKTTAPVFGGDANAAANSVAKLSLSEEVEVVLYEKVAIRDGKNAGNPLLQEMPDPISKIAWDNYIALSPKFAKEKGLAQNDLARVQSGNYEVVLPVHIQPGTAYGVAAIALGYGREAVGKAGAHIGKNVFPFIKNGNLYAPATIEKAGGTYPLAQTQTYHSIFDGLNERRIVKETTLEEYKKNPFAGNEDRAHVQQHLLTLYGYHDYPGHHWGMAVDLNSCIGCGACIVACNVENNVPVVGKDEVLRAREMHWLRIDRYYAGDEENPTVIFQPMMCQHCDNAPCENVCPVAATNHSSEGLNQMAYNRCIGTRYCANNCPYKVRRFNWFDYWGADSFTEKTTLLENNYDPLGMTENLTRMVLNPDVTVRSRGVIEKCSFCVQRIQEGKLKAKKEGRKLKDGEIKTACQAACATGAIVFGDLNDQESVVSKLSNDERAFKVIEEIHTLPSVAYLTKVRNKPAEAKTNINTHHG
jgi:molybdopterin-containing oxidoreductase family iron-sulfur binding subunit